jgi:hypothetical protein
MQCVGFCLQRQQHSNACARRQLLPVLCLHTAGTAQSPRTGELRMGAASRIQPQRSEDYSSPMGNRTCYHTHIMHMQPAALLCHTGKHISSLIFILLRLRCMAGTRT